jgi:DNA modification methylase
MAGKAQMHIEFVETSRLHAHERNYRSHPKEQITHLQQSLKQFGFYRNVVVANDNTILAGHGVVEAAKANHVRRIPVVRLAIASDDPKALKVLVADNTLAFFAEDDADALAVLLNELDSDLLGTGFDLDDFAEDSIDVPEANVDQAKELQAKWKTRLGQIWVVGGHRLLCGDSTNAGEVHRLLCDARPNLTVTDPPYGVEYDPNWRNVEAAKGNLAYGVRRVGVVRNDEQIDWGKAWANVPSDVLYCWHAGRYGSTVQDSLEAAGFEVRCQIIWAKSNFAISRGHYHWGHEPCWYAVRKGKQAHWIGDRKQTTLWNINLDQNVNGGHSTQKPAECMARPIRNHAGDVFDPFVGTGTTICAAERLQRRCFAIEIDPAYVAVSLERLAEMGLKSTLCKK